MAAQFCQIKSSSIVNPQVARGNPRWGNERDNIKSQWQWQQIPMLPWLKLSEKGFMVMAFYRLHHATLYHYTSTLCRGWGRGQETLSIYLHNIAKIFASRLRLVRSLLWLPGRAGPGWGQERWVISSACLSIYPFSRLSTRPSVLASLTIVFIVSYNF